MYKCIAIALAGVLSVTGVAASAASVLPAPSDSYVGDYKTESINSGSNLHTFWLPNLLGDPNSRDYWQFDGNGGSFVHDGAQATLSGTIQNNVLSEALFDVDISFGFTQKGGRTPKCELGAACSSEPYLTNQGFFEYFDFQSATLTGLGSLSGLILSLTMAPADGTYPPQLGYGANNKDVNEFGLSTWFYWQVLQQPKYGHFYGGKGDINLELVPVPVPAALPLLLGAVGWLGLCGHRRRKAIA